MQDANNTSKAIFLGKIGQETLVVKIYNEKIEEFVFYGQFILHQERYLWNPPSFHLGQHSEESLQVVVDLLRRVNEQKKAQQSPRL
jgi:hypothetical protein